MKTIPIARAAAALGCGSLLGIAPCAAQDATFPLTAENGVVSVSWQGESQARAGQSYQYELRVRNTSDLPVHDVVVHQTLPEGFELQESNPPTLRHQRLQGRNGEDFAEGRQRMELERQERRQQAAEAARASMDGSSGNAQDQRRNRQGQNPEPQNAQSRQDRNQPANPQAERWRLGMLEPGATKVISITGRAAQEGQLETCLWVTCQPTFCRTIDVVKPQLSLEQTILDGNGSERDIFYACENIVLRYELTNPGSGETEDAQIQIDLPEGFTLNGESQPTLEVGTLDAGETVTRNIRLEASDPGNFNISATASTGDLKSSSGQASVEIVKPELKLTVDSPQTAYLGRSVTYNITVENTGDVPALETVVEFPLEAEAQRFSSTGERIDGDVERFRVGDLDAGQSKSFGITFDPGQAGSIETTAVATAYCARDARQEVVTNVQGVPALQVVVVDQQDPVQVGNETTYELQVRNEGTAQDLNIQLSGELPEQLEFVSAEGDSNVKGQGGTLEFSPIDQLEPGEVASWLITVRGTEQGRGSFDLEVKSDAVTDLTSSEPTTVY